LAATGAAYALIAFVLLTLVGLWRGRGGRAAPAPVPEPAPLPTQFAPDPVLERIIGSRPEPPQPSAEIETVRRLTELRRLRDSGLIGEEDYETKKREILAGL